MSNTCKTRNYTCLTKVFSKRQYWTSLRYHLVLIVTGNFGGQMLMLKASPLDFDTSSLYWKYFVLRYIVVWLFSPNRRFLCSWPARTAKCYPHWNTNISKSFLGVYLPRIPLHHMISTSAEITSALFLSRPKPRIDKSFKSPKHFLVSTRFLIQNTDETLIFSHMMLIRTNYFKRTIWLVVLPRFIPYFSHKETLTPVYFFIAHVYNIFKHKRVVWLSPLSARCHFTKMFKAHFHFHSVILKTLFSNKSSSLFASKV